MKNLARQKCLFDLITGITKSRKVQLPEIAQAVQSREDTRSVKSIVHRFEDFFREVELDYEMLALLFLFCLGENGKIRLCLDRTEWDFGRCQVNILMLTASCGAVQVPLFWELLDNKSGNSNTIQRIDLIQKAIDLIGAKRIGILIADREFIGHQWLKYLKNNGIDFCVRVPKSHNIILQDGTIHKAEMLLQKHKTCFFSQAMVDNIWVSVYLKRLKGDEILFLIGVVKEVSFLPQIYQKRWQIECFFQHLKGRGFDIESTQMKCLKKLKMLVGIVGIASVLCQTYGVYYHEKVQKIKLKKHGYKTKSFARVGLDKWRWVFKQSLEYFETFIDKFIRYLRWQKHKYLQNNHSLNYLFKSG